MSCTRCDCIYEPVELDHPGLGLCLIVADPDCRATHAVVVES